MTATDNFVTLPIRVECREGKKQLHYPQGWTTLSREELDKLTLPYKPNARAVITGKASGITVVDIDNAEALEEFERHFNIELFNACGYIVKTARGWHFYFGYEPLVGTTARYGGIRGVDIRNDGGNVVWQVDEDLPCASYEVIKDEGIVPMPDNIVFKGRASTGIVQKEESVLSKSSTPLAVLLGYLLDASIVNHRIRPVGPNADRIKAALRRLTPTVFRSGEMGTEYSELFEDKGYLEPSDIRDGDGHEYLVRVRGILARDPSVSIDLFRRVMVFLNHAWEYPIEDKHFEKTLLNPNFTSEGGSIWEYNPNWETEYEEGSLINRMKEAGYEMWIDPDTGEYILLYLPSGKLYRHTKQSFTQIVRSVLETTEPFKEWHNLPIIETLFEPYKPTFFTAEDGLKVYNPWKQTPLLELYQLHQEPKAYPATIMAIIENLFPIETVREGFLNWLAVWFARLEKSKVAWVITSDEGAGKGLLTDHIIAPIVGTEFCALNVGQGQVQEDFSGWLEGKLFVNLNEISNSYSDKDKVHNKIKAWITDDHIMLRKMRRDAYSVRNWANFIITSNDFAPIEIGYTDRRFSVSKADMVLKDIPELKKLIDQGQIVDTIERELPDFVRFLSTMPRREDLYNKVFADETYKKAIQAQNSRPIERFTRLVSKAQWDILATECEEYDEALMIQIKSLYNTEKWVPTNMIFALYKHYMGDPETKVPKKRISSQIKTAGVKVGVQKIGGKFTRVYDYRS